MSQNGIIAATSSVLVFVISSIMFFMIGYFCGYRHKVQERNLSSPETRNPAAIVYEDVLPQHNTKNFDLKPNVAYAQSIK